jgi:acetyltransferase-like isoleucine patch superfamily enzyme
MRFLEYPKSVLKEIESHLFARLQYAYEHKRERISKSICIADSTASFYPETKIYNTLGKKEKIQIGPHTACRGEINVFAPDGRVIIGSYCYIGDHSRIWSAISITVGNRVLISHGVNIHDHDSHPFSAAKRHAQEKGALAEDEMNMSGVAAAPVVIEDDVWIGFNAIILKGVTVGHGAIIGAASVITKDVPPYAIMVGNPARQVGTARE